MLRGPSSKDYLFLEVAEALLAFQVAAYPELAVPDDTDVGFHARNRHDSRYSVLFSQILGYERRVERNLSEYGNDVGVPFSYEVVIDTDDDAHVVCREGAIVGDRHRGIVGFILSRPTVSGLVTAGAECSLADRVRVFAYLVRVSSKLVGSRGGVTAFGADAVGFFRDVVGVLRHLVGLARQHQGDDAGHGTDAAEDGADPFCRTHESQSTKEVA